MSTRAATTPSRADRAPALATGGATAERGAPAPLRPFLAALRLIDAVVRWLLRVPVRAYQLIISPWLPPMCRHEPSCSRYAMEALRVHPSPVALWLIAKRLWHCQPMYPGGYDPVPPRGGTCGCGHRGEGDPADGSEGREQDSLSSPSA